MSHLISIINDRSHHTGNSKGSEVPSQEPRRKVRLLFGENQILCCSQTRDVHFVSIISFTPKESVSSSNSPNI